MLEMLMNGRLFRIKTAKLNKYALCLHTTYERNDSPMKEDDVLKFKNQSIMLQKCIKYDKPIFVYVYTRRNKNEQC
jgi:hypothetical protein